MSFILDALRRADRERESERAAVPSLHTQAAPPPQARARRDDKAPRPWLWLAAGLGAGLVMAALWALWSATPSSTATPAAAPGPVAAAPSAAVATTPATPPSPERAAPPTPTPTSPPTEATAQPGLTPRAAPSAGMASARPPEPAPRAQAQPAPRPTPPIASRERDVAPRSEATRPSPTEPARRPDDDRSAAASPADPPIRQLGELSAEQRKALPTLTISGAMYSAKAANRRLIVNGQLLSESDAVAPGVTLEEIRLKSAVLRTKDLRVELGF